MALIMVTLVLILLILLVRPPSLLLITECGVGFSNLQ